MKRIYWQNTYLMNHQTKITYIGQDENEIIISVREITEEYNSQGLRSINIEKLCIDPCSGTHVTDTSQIDHYLIRKLETKKGRLTVGYDAKYRVDPRFKCR